MPRSWLILIAVLLTSSLVFAKGDGVGVYLDGAVSNVQADGREIRFRLNGTLELKQFHRGRQSVIRIQSADAVTVKTKQVDFCFVLIDDWSWNPGPCQPGQLLKALERASREHVQVRLELSRTTLRFGGENVEVTESETLRLSAPTIPGSTGKRDR